MSGASSVIIDTNRYVLLRTLPPLAGDSGLTIIDSGVAADLIADVIRRGVFLL